jgi:putative membrane protein
LLVCAFSDGLPGIHILLLGVIMKRFLTLITAVLLFAIAVILGLKNQQLINVNYLIAENEVRLATLLAIIFMAGFIAATLFAGLFYLKLKMKNRQLRRLNNKQRKELNQLRAITASEKD